MSNNRYLFSVGGQPWSHKQWIHVLSVDFCPQGSITVTVCKSAHRPTCMCTHQSLQCVNPKSGFVPETQQLTLHLIWFLLTKPTRQTNVEAAQVSVTVSHRQSERRSTSFREETGNVTKHVLVGASSPDLLLTPQIMLLLVCQCSQQSKAVLSQGFSNAIINCHPPRLWSTELQPLQPQRHFSFVFVLRYICCFLPLIKYKKHNCLTETNSLPLITANVYTATFFAFCL